MEYLFTDFFPNCSQIATSANKSDDIIKQAIFGGVHLHLFCGLVNSAKVRANQNDLKRAWGCIVHLNYD